MLERSHAFRYFIKSIEIEISSACNRRCDYCPQSFLAREQQLLPLDAFEKIIGELAALNYRGSIAFHLYNEPLLVPDHLFACLAVVRQRLPQCSCVLFTNGDLMTPELLDRLAESGIVNICMTCHTAPGQSFDPEKMLGRIVLRTQKLHLPLQLAMSKDSVANIAKYKNMQISIRSSNFSETGYDRLQTVPGGSKNIVPAERNICCQLFHYLHISYKGNIPLCCECCDGVDKAAPYFLGNVIEQSLLDVFDKKLEQIQNYMFGTLPQCCIPCKGYC